ncbi:MAG: SpoVA/SpoVAEb family sporulation membrane protein [Clostridia bacterium]|nr:SpoVA/SpoVAEb family sporulation membrane protein [Clostridia bacterium]
MRVIEKQEWEKRNRNRKGEKVLRTCKENILPSENEYKKLVEKKTPNSKKIAGFLKAFWVGGVICVIGYYVNMLGSAIGFSEKNLPMFTASVLVYLGTLLTGVGIYDKIGKYAGAGSIVPITGFANSVCAPAMEFRREGVITGIGAKLFTIAGPVLTYGISASVVYGFIYWIKEYLLK